MQMELRHDIQQQMEYERIKRHRKSNANMGGIGRHNPITNPIEYHIDNPYILNQIQHKERERTYQRWPIW